jgi:hypothetical protein
MPTICLNMIVRNETGVLYRCLESVRPWIDHWVVVDTGSEDGTQELVHELLDDLPGTLHERPWRDFGHNRTEALELAAGCADHVLFIDADEVLIAEPRFAFPDPMPDALMVRHEVAGSDVTFLLPQVIRNSLRWRWQGVVHEYLACDVHHSREVAEGLRTRGFFDGARNRDPRAKYLADARLLEGALDADPSDSRAAFYLAQSYRDAGETQKAVAAYATRAGMPGWDEETWYALYQVAVLSERLGRPAVEIVDSYLRAFQARPGRAEPLCGLARFCRLRGDYALAVLFARAALVLPRPDDRLFLDESAYAWRSLDEYSVAVFWAGDPEASVEATRRLAESGRLPASEADRVAANLRLVEEHVSKAAGGAPAPHRQRPREGAEGEKLPVTVTVTSCRRLELLRRNLDSIVERCLDIDRVTRWICVDDGSSEADLRELAEAYPWLEIFHTDADDRGQAAAIRRMWSLVGTELVFHIEDDWLFVEDFFLADLKEALGPADQLVLLWDGRELDRTFNPRHPLITSELEEIAHRHGYTTRPKEDSGWWWPGFSLNPSLFRIDRVRTLVPEVPDGDHFEFEYALQLHRAGLEVRHRRQAIEHLGDVSAYLLSDRPRPTDMRDLSDRIAGLCARDPGRALELADHLDTEALDDGEACRAGLATATAQWYVDRKAGRATLRELWLRRHGSGFLFSLDAADLLNHYGETWESLLGLESIDGDVEEALARPVPDRVRLRELKREGEHSSGFELPDEPPRCEGGAGVTLVMTSCRRLELLLRTVASFLACCSDHHLIDRWICIDDNSDPAECDVMARRLPWFEFVWKSPEDRGHARSLQMLHEMVTTPHVFQLEDDHEFFVRSDYVSRCLHGLSVGTSIGQCLVNLNYAETLADYGLAGGMPYQHGGRSYVAHLYDRDRRMIEGLSNSHWPHFSLRPGVTRTEVWDLGFRDVPFFEREFAARYTVAGWLTIFLPDIYHRHIGKLTTEEGDNAYTLNRVEQF